MTLNTPFTFYIQKNWIFNYINIKDKKILRYKEFKKENDNYIIKYENVKENFKSLNQYDNYNDYIKDLILLIKFITNIGLKYGYLNNNLIFDNIIYNNNVIKIVDYSKSIFGFYLTEKNEELDNLCIPIIKNYNSFCKKSKYSLSLIKNEYNKYPTIILDIITIGQEFKNKYKIDEIDEIFYPNIISLISLIKK